MMMMKKMEKGKGQHVVFASSLVASKKIKPLSSSAASFALSVCRALLQPKTRGKVPTKLPHFPSLFLSLPADLILFIKTFLFNEDWFQFISISRTFLNIRKMTGYYHLNRWLSLKFYYQFEFQQYILTKLLTNPALQLSLTFDHNCNLKEDYFHCFHKQGLRIHCLIIRDCHEMKRIEIYDCVNHLIIEYCSKLNDVSSFVSVEKLEIRNCPNVQKIEMLKNIRNLILENISPLANYSKLGNHEDLRISGEKVTVPNVSVFQSVRGLDLSHCLGFTNLHSLKYVSVLNLSYCSQIKDVSSLGGVMNLNLSYCVDIEDISGLGKGNRIVNLSGCPKITDVQSLASCYDVTLADCIGITDVSPLEKVHRVNLSGCVNVSDVNMLGSVYELDVSKNDSLFDISGLGKHQYSVNVSNCSNIRSFCSLRNVKKINLSHCNASVIFDSLPDLRHGETLIVSEDYYKIVARPSISAPHRNKGWRNVKVCVDDDSSHSSPSTRSTTSDILSMEVHNRSRHFLSF